MAVHVRLKNEFTEDEKCHNLMSWLISFLVVTVYVFLDHLESHQERYHTNVNQTVSTDFGLMVRSPELLRVGDTFLWQSTYVAEK